MESIIQNSLLCRGRLIIFSALLGQTATCTVDGKESSFVDFLNYLYRRMHSWKKRSVIGLGLNVKADVHLELNWTWDSDVPVSLRVCSVRPFYVEVFLSLTSIGGYDYDSYHVCTRTTSKVFQCDHWSTHFDACDRLVLSLCALAAGVGHLQLRVLPLEPPHRLLPPADLCQRRGRGARLTGEDAALS